MAVRVGTETDAADVALPDIGFQAERLAVALAETAPWAAEAIRHGPGVTVDGWARQARATSGNVSMNADDLDERFAFALDLIKEAGSQALAAFRDVATLTVKTKGLQDFVSEADLQVELAIRRRLAETFPRDGFFGEETGRAGIEGKDAVWVVDPIDGTQPFLNGLSSWCVSIALVYDGAVQMGLVYAPARDELFAGSRRHPATLNGQRIAVRQCALTDGLVATGHCTRVPPDEFVVPFLGLLKAGGMFYRDGSGALSLCYVACGRLIGFMEQHINAWDCLGGLAIIEAAGGASNDFLADDGLLKGGRLIAASPALLPDLAAAIGWTFPGRSSRGGPEREPR